MSGNSTPPDPLKAFTDPGRLLVISSTLFGAAVCYYCIADDLFAPGLHPIFIFLLPGFVGAAALFCVGCIVYRILGIRVWKAPTPNDGATAEEPRADHRPEAPIDDQRS